MRQRSYCPANDPHITPCPTNLRTQMPWRHVNHIAEEVAGLKLILDDREHREVALAMARVCAKWCLRFSQEEFLNKCGVWEGK